MRGWIQRAKGLARHHRAGAGQQRVLEFDEGRLDPLVAVRRQHPHKPRHHLGFELGLGGQQIVKAGRQ